MKLLWLLWLFVFLPAVLGQAGFGRSYLKNSRLCHQWNCISTKLGLPDSLPSKEVSEDIFRRVLPQGHWQDVLGTILDNCYENRTRRFTNTCPGQALMHCVVDQMIDFCPVSSTRKDDSCSPVTSLAGLKYMFSQSRYVDLEKNLPRERRPTWFLKNYFDSKCCDLPVIFNTTVLEECGFSTFINYFDHGPRYTDVQTVDFQNAAAVTTDGITAPYEATISETAFETTPANDAKRINRKQTVFMPFDIPVENAATVPEAITTERAFVTTPTYDTKGINRKETVFMPFDIPVENTATLPMSPAPKPTAGAGAGEQPTRKRLSVYDFSGTPLEIPSDEPTDPLDCCEMTKFINPSWRSECDFHLSFKGQDRLVIASHSPVTEASTTTTTERTKSVEDVMLVPQSCEKETCVFRQMGIITDSGILDIDAYIKMLHNFTETHPTWSKATSRVLTKCVFKPVRSFEAGCEINNMLACTLDVLTENCPYKRKSNICKHGNHEVPCQISSSKYRPKNRREVCLLPELIHRSNLQECGLEALYKVEHVAVLPKIRNHGWSANRYTCKESKEPTSCMMTKMGVLNKYNFMDYFKMKDRIRQFTTDQVEWAALLDIYMSAFINIPMYGEHCNSEKKLLNVIDAMLMTCPVSKRKNTVQCNKIFLDMTHTAPDKQNVTKEKLDEIMKHYHHVFMPNQPVTTNLNRAIRKKHSRTVKKPVYDSAFFNAKEAPPVRVISVKPEVITRPNIPPLILRPVYLRPEFGRGPVNDGVFRSNPHWVHDQIALAHMSTSSTIPPILHTLPGFNSYINARRPLFRPTVPYMPPTTPYYDSTELPM